MFVKNWLEEAGKKFVRPETGFIHYTYHTKGETSHATIPLYENLNWALANFMLKTQEGVTEGKRLLKALLAFQNAEGEFPVYLHEYPVSKDYFLGAYLFHPLFLIKKEFNHVLGKEHALLLDKALKGLIGGLKKRFQEKNPQGHICVKVGAAFLASGIEEGKEILDNLLPSFPSSFHIADRELARDLGAVNLPAWPQLYWHPHLKVYSGPAYKERQEGDRPEVTLLDLMMGAQGKGPLTPHHLAAALVRSAPLPADLQPKGTVSEKSFCWSALEQAEGQNGFEPGFHLFRLLTEGEGKVDSLAIPGGRFKKVTFEEIPNGVQLQFHLSDTFDPENRDSQREIDLFFNLGAKLEGSVFRFNEPIEIFFKTTKVTLKFSLKEGSGDFIGHRARGNRPAQLLKEGVYDELLYIRTLRRSQEAIIELKILVECL